MGQLINSPKDFLKTPISIDVVSSFLYACGELDISITSEGCKIAIQNGFGIEHYPSGCVKYVGEFRNGLYHGNGKFYWETFPGTSLKRMDGTIAKPHDSNGFLMYEGEFRDGTFNGNGTSYFSDGRLCHKGLFQDGRPATI